MKAASSLKHLRHYSVRVAALLFMAIALQACAAWQAPAQDRPLATIVLLVDTSVMPSGWTMVDKRRLSKEADDLSVGDSAVVVFAIKELQIPRPTKEYVHRYRNAAVAQSVYEDLIHLVGVVPPSWAYQSAIASQSSVACYDYEGREPYPVCEWAAQYEEYVVTVSTWLIPEHMSLPDVEKVIRAIDKQMARQLGRS
jgi:hypothetical protein